jgi:xanthine dehydrogenase YagS FAD-binding subunit
MNNFIYYQPSTLPQALALLERKVWGKTELLAGGTDLLDRQKDYIDKPEKVISLTGIKELSTITVGKQADGSVAVTIGAGAKLAEIAGHSEIGKQFPALAVAARVIAGPQIRNMGTLGGSLCQRNRCWYFRDEKVKCLLKGGDKCYALPADAENRYHAIFIQGQKCVMVSPSTLGPVLIALGANAEIVTGPNQTRKVALADFFVSPSNADEREHALAPGEILKSVTIAATRPSNASYEVRQKESSDWPLVQAVAAYVPDGGKAKNVMIVMGHVAPTPVVAAEAMKILEGAEITEESAAAAGKAAVRGAKPLGQNAYKVRLAEVAVKRAILAAAGKKYWEA